MSILLRIVKGEITYMRKLIFVLFIMISLLFTGTPIYGDEEEIDIETGEGESSVNQYYSLGYTDNILSDKYKVVLEWNTSPIEVSMERNGVWNTETEKWDYTYLPTNESIGKEASFAFTNKSSKSLNVEASFIPDSLFTMDDNFIVRIGHKDALGNMSDDYVENEPYNLKLGSNRVIFDALSRRTIMTKIKIKDSKFAGLDTTNEGILGYYHFNISTEN